MKLIWILGAGVAVASVAAIAGLYIWASVAGALTSKRSFADLKTLLRNDLQVHRPEGAGPFPTVIAFSGCGGVRRVQGMYAEQAKDEGVMTIVVDSFTPRGIDYETAVAKVCKGRLLRGGERAGDVWAALELAREIDGVDPNRIALLGWSHGGWSIMDALTFDPNKGQYPYSLSDGPPDPFAGVVAINLIYPFANFPARTKSHGWIRNDIPVRALIVTGDKMANPEILRDTLRALENDNVSLETIEMDNVTHGFDEDDHHPKSALQYDRDATNAVLASYAGWLNATFSNNPPLPSESDASTTADGA